MKTLAILGTFFLGFNLFGQDLAVVDNNQNNILYRGFENRIVLDQAGDDSETFQIEAVNCKVSKLENSGSENTYLVKTDNKAKTAKITIVADGQTIDSYNFEVKNLPAPSLYWGSNKAGSTVSNDAALQIKYMPGVTLNADFEIVGWSFSQGDVEFDGEGNLLSQETLAHAKSMAQGESITIEVKVKGADGIIRKLSGSWVK